LQISGRTFDNVNMSEIIKGFRINVTEIVHSHLKNAANNVLEFMLKVSQTNMRNIVQNYT